MDSREKRKQQQTFFDIEKAYDKVNREKTFEKLENTGIQERMMNFTKELISERWINVGIEDTFHRANRQTYEFHRDGCSV